MAGVPKSLTGVAQYSDGGSRDVCREAVPRPGQPTVPLLPEERPHGGCRTDHTVLTVLKGQLRSWRGTANTHGLDRGALSNSLGSANSLGGGSGCWIMGEKPAPERAKLQSQTVNAFGVSYELISRQAALLCRASDGWE